MSICTNNFMKLLCCSPFMYTRVNQRFITVLWKKQQQTIHMACQEIWCMYASIHGKLHIHYSTDVHFMTNTPSAAIYPLYNLRPCLMYFMLERTVVSDFIAVNVTSNQVNSAHQWLFWLACQRSTCCGRQIDANNTRWQQIKPFDNVNNAAIKP